ncbi:TonB-dependent receptor domain-containing protein [Hydrogenophaga sp. UC242_50]
MPRSLPSAPRRWRATVLACAAALATLGASAALAQGASSAALAAPHAFNLGAQPLGQALNALARQAGVAISVNAELVAGKSAAALSGTMSLREALERVLAGSGLDAHLEGGSVVLRPASAAPAADRALREVRVVAERTSPGTFRLDGEPGPVEPGIVTARTLERHAANDLEDVFASQPEMAVGGGHAIAQKIYLRGVEDTLLNVTIDGAGQVAQAFHHTGRVQLEPELIKRVEVRPGTGDATAGPGALGGVVRFVTKDPEDLLREGQSVGALLKGSYFSNSEGLKLHTSVYGRLAENWSAMAALTDQDFKDYQDGAGRRVANTGSQQALGFFKLVGKLAQDHTVRLSYDRHEDEGLRTQRPQWIASSFNRAYPLQSERETWNLGYTYRPASNPLFDVAFNLYQTDTDIEQNVIGRWGRYRGSIESTGFDLRNTSHLERHEITYGVDHRKDRSSAGPATNPTSERERGGVTGFYVQDRITLTPELTLDLGARHDRYTLKDTNGLSFSHSGTSPNASVRYAVTPQLALLAGHSRALRGPKIRDAFKLDTITNDPNMRPERARTSELGFEYTRSAWRFNGKVYDTTIRDVIADPIGNPARYFNVGELRSRGALLHTTYDWKQVQLGAGLHHNRATLNGQRLNVYDHNGLGASMGNTLTTSVDWRVTSRVDVGWAGRFVQGIGSLDTPVGRVRKPGYAVHDLYANWRPTGRDSFTLTFAISNLFDKDYLDHASNEDFQRIPGYEGIVGSREPGRELRLTATLRF